MDTPAHPPPSRRRRYRTRTSPEVHPIMRHLICLSSLCVALAVCSAAAPPIPGGKGKAPRDVVFVKEDELTSSDPFDFQQTTNRRKAFEFELEAGKQYGISANSPNFSP